MTTTSLRTRPLAQTLALAQRLAPRLGVTACTDYTPRDTLGVPIWFSERQSVHGVQSHSGKGVHPQEAEVGGWVEAIENAVAERAGQRFQGDHVTLGALVAALGPHYDVTDLAPRLGMLAPPDRIVPVETCFDLASGVTYQLPAELLHQGLAAVHAGTEGWLFGMSSNGLAGGNTLPEATLHALLEVLERDAVALDMARPASRAIRADTLPEPFRSWQSTWRDHGVALHVRQLPSVVGLPCVLAELTDTRSVARQAPRGLGFGLHPHPPVALARAVTEAAQSRLHQLCFDAPKGARGNPSARYRTPVEAPDIPFEAMQATPCDNIAQALDDVIERLLSRGFPRVLRRHLNERVDAADLDGLHVVRVVVPGCESTVAGPVRMGRRLAGRLAGLDVATWDD